MTPDDEREAQYADELVAQLDPADQADLLRDWATYLVDRQQTDSPTRHRDFALGWIARHDAQRPRDARERQEVREAQRMATTPPDPDPTGVLTDVVEDYKRRKAEVLRQWREAQSMSRSQANGTNESPDPEPQP